MLALNLLASISKLNNQIGSVSGLLAMAVNVTRPEVEKRRELCLVIWLSYV